MHKETDLYKILEVSKEISNSDLKKHFKKLALKWHPDKNKANIKTPADKLRIQSKFKDIVEAMDVLGDETKRQIYDIHGMEGVKEMEARKGQSF